MYSDNNNNNNNNTNNNNNSNNNNSNISYYTYISNIINPNLSFIKLCKLGNSYMRILKIELQNVQ